MIAGLVGACSHGQDRLPPLGTVPPIVTVTVAVTAVPESAVTATTTPATVAPGADCSGESPVDPCVPAETVPVPTLPKCEDPDDATDPDEPPCLP